MATLDDLKQKRDQLNARIQQVEARERAQQKKADDKVKILVGAALLDQIKRGGKGLSDLLALMDGFLTRPYERKSALGEDGKGSEVLHRLTQRGQ
ncbi:MAG: hypothetical protein GAK45_02017 [Pseudomonas citronellolis]|nr:MAG: hypothetical protein GAK45_02017 [Pseudomonas citronellolis]